MALALRPLLSDSSMKSRWGSQALAVTLRPGAASVGTPLAGFGGGDAGSFADVRTLADDAAVVDAADSTPKSGDTLAGFASGGCLPQPPGDRTAMPAAFRQALAVSRRTPVSFSM